MMLPMLDTKDTAETPGLNPVGGSPRCVGPYTLRRELGRGGMSVVYEARDTRTGDEVALKLLALPPTLSAEEADDLVARFEREARTMSRLPHPNIVAIHEIGVSQGQHFLAMEFLRGQTLRERLSRSRLTAREAYAILAQVADAVDAVHDTGIIHRDVKPSNVMLLPDGTAKLLDFGIARSREEAAITGDGAVIGTPSYMAPEQVRGEPAAPSTDLWSLGVLSYEMFAGHLPFGGGIVPNVLYQVLNKAPAPTPNLPKGVQKVLRRALEKNPAHRYGSAGALVQALKSALPKSALPQEAPAAPKPAAFDLRSVILRPVPRWAQGLTLLLLFTCAFAVTEHGHPPAGGAAPNKASAPTLSVPPPAPALPASAAAFPGPAVQSVPQATEPYWVRPAPQPPTAAPTNLLPGRENASPPRHQSSAQAGMESGVPDTAPSALPQVPVRRSAAASPEAPPQPDNGSVPQRAVPAAPSDDAPVQVQTPVQAPVQAEGDGSGSYQAHSLPQAPVQTAPQAVTLPDAGNGGYDPEAEARLRKRGWSETDGTSGP